MSKVVICDHPLIQHKLTFIRNKDTNTKDFRELVDEVATLMAYEITRDIPLDTITVETPVATTEAKVVSGRMLGLVPILRAGLGMVEGMLKLIPGARLVISALCVTTKPFSLWNITLICRQTQLTAS